MPLSLYKKQLKNLKERKKRLEPQIKRLGRKIKNYKKAKPSKKFRR